MSVVVVVEDVVELVGVEVVVVEELERNPQHVERVHGLALGEETLEPFAREGGDALEVVPLGCASTSARRPC